MPGPSPLNSACNCCVQSTPAPALQFVAAKQSCTTKSCGDTPCTSTDAVYGSNGKCVSAKTVCSPNWAELSRAEKCANKKYLTVTTVDTSGGGTHGRTSVKQYTTNAEGICTSKTTCSGSSTVVTVQSFDESLVEPPGDTYDPPDSTCSGTATSDANLTTTKVTTWNSDCSGTDITTCEGSSSRSGSGQCIQTSTGQLLVSYNYQCSGSVSSDCVWSSTSTSSTNGAPDPWPITFSGPCEVLNKTDSVTTTPTPDCTVTVTYTGENEQGDCTPKEFPAFPEFWDQHGRWIGQCTQDESIELVFPKYGPGQSGFTPGGATAISHNAYKYVNPHNPQIKSEQKAKYRPEHRPTSTCYLKMWFRKVVQKWKYEDCDTGFPGDPPRTQPAAINCNANGGFQCYSRWSTDGAPTYQDDGDYEWKGTGYPCYEDEDKTPYDCTNYITDTPVKDLNAAENTSVTVETKWSFIKDYEPNWYDKNGSQGCKPNGYPTPNPEDCPEYTP